MNATVFAVLALALSLTLITGRPFKSQIREPNEDEEKRFFPIPTKEEYILYRKRRQILNENGVIPIQSENFEYDEDDLSYHDALQFGIQSVMPDFKKTLTGYLDSLLALVFRSDK